MGTAAESPFGAVGSVLQLPLDTSFRFAKLELPKTSKHNEQSREMPPRTNEFQQLIYLVQHSLAGRATVRESAMLTDRLTGEDREVDILIESETAGHKLAISIECVASRRKATVEWVERMWAKHQNLPTNKLVLVSRSGFTADARAKAALLNIDAVDLSRALEADWNSVISQLAQLEVTVVDSELTWCKAVLPEPPIRPVSGIESAILYLPTGQPLGTLQEMIHSFQQSPNLKKVINSVGGHPEGAAELENVIEFPDGTFFVAPDRTPIRILRVRFGLTATWRSSPVALETHSYGGVHIAHGAETTVLGPSRIALVQQQGEPLVIAVGLLDEKGQIKSVQQFRGASHIIDSTENTVTSES
jgi:Restriction endonuclease